MSRPARGTPPGTPSSKPFSSKRRCAASCGAGSRRAPAPRTPRTSPPGSPARRGSGASGRPGPPATASPRRPARRRRRRRAASPAPARRGRRRAPSARLPANRCGSPASMPATTRRSGNRSRHSSTDGQVALDVERGDAGAVAPIDLQAVPAVLRTPAAEVDVLGERDGGQADLHGPGAGVAHRRRVGVPRPLGVHVVVGWQHCAMLTCPTRPVRTGPRVGRRPSRSAPRRRTSGGAASCRRTWPGRRAPPPRWARAGRPRRRRRR